MILSGRIADGSAVTVTAGEGDLIIDGLRAAA
jgi:hypothetical protein